MVTIQIKKNPSHLQLRNNKNDNTESFNKQRIRMVYTESEWLYWLPAHAVKNNFCLPEKT